MGSILAGLGAMPVSVRLSFWLSASLSLSVSLPACVYRVGFAELCADVSCSGHGTCHDLEGLAACFCEPGFQAYQLTDCVRAGGGIPCATAADCDDTDPCTDDLCDPVQGCLYSDIAGCAGTCPAGPSGPCEDGDPCTVGDQCSAGTCLPGNARDCSAFSGPCSLGVCAQAAGGCFAQPVNESGACDDGDACTSASSCGSGACVSGPADRDGDNDGYVDALCGGPDCNDGDALESPALVESLAAGTCADGLDNDCDGATDGADLAGCSTCAAQGGSTCAADETCASAPLPSLDNPSCCAAGDCLARADKLVAEVPRTTASVVIDGQVGDWAGVQRMPLTKVRLDAGVPGLAGDFSGTLALQWDDSGLYALIELHDDVLGYFDQNLASERNMTYNDDCVEIYLDLDPRTPDATFGPEERWTWVARDAWADRTQTPGAWLPGWPNVDAAFDCNITAVPADGVTSCSASGGDSWWFELWIPWPSGTPSPEDVIGFDAAANDDDDNNGGGVRRNQIWWNDVTGTLYNTPSKYGLLRLLPDGVPPSTAYCGNSVCDPGESTVNCPADC